MGGASPEGVSAARGFLYILAMLCLWALVFALRAVPRAVTILLRLMLVMLALAALGVACVAVIAQVVLAIGPI
jgi:heme A synthase